ncbi:MAG: DNA primase [Nitrosotalea sp.]
MTQEPFDTRYDVKNPKILDEITKGYSNKIVGESNNIKVLFGACISRNLPRKYRLSVIIASQSSAGKSNLVNNILAPFRKDVIDYTDYSQAFLKRQIAFSLDGKIFKMEQMERTNENKQVSIGSLKFLLTEGKIRVGLVERDQPGKQTPTTFEVNGIPVFISTSTNFNIDPETLNRTFLGQVDETEEQTKRIVSHIFDNYSTLAINDKWESEVKELEKLVEIYKGLCHQITDIIIPFGKKIMDRIPTKQITIRRDLQKILNLTCVITLLHASNRIRIQDMDGKNFIGGSFGETEQRYTYALIAEPSDFKEALEIAGSTIKQTLNKLNESSMEIFAKIKQACYEKANGNKTQETLDPLTAEEGVTVKEMATILKKSDNRTRELMNQLWDAGFLHREKLKSKEYTYYLTEKEFEKIDVNDIEFTQEELQKWIKEQTSMHHEKLRVLYPGDSVIVS